MNARALLAVPALTVALGLAACGGSKSLSHDDLVKKADAICTDGNTEIAKITAPTDLSDATVAAPYLTKLTAVTSKQGKKLHDLKAGGDDKDKYATFLDKFDAAETQLEKIRDKAKAKDASGLADLQAFQAKYGTPSDKAADAVGLKVCGSSSS